MCMTVLVDKPKVTLSSVKVLFSAELRGRYLARQRWVLPACTVPWRQPSALYLHGRHLVF